MDKMKFMALLTATGMLFSPMVGLADNYHNEKAFVQPDQEELELGEYFMEKGDNLSLISLRIYGDSKFWAVLAFINGYPKIGQIGDRIIYFKSYDRMVNIYNHLRKTGWIARYIQKNKVYKKTVDDYHLSYEEVVELLSAIYGDEECIDPDFVQTYIDMHDNSLTEWIPTIEEINEFREQKTYKKR